MSAVRSHDLSTKGMLADTVEFRWVTRGYALGPSAAGE
jgi:hypothetical protein